MASWLYLLLKLLACWSLTAASEGWSSQNLRSLPNWPVQKAYWESQSSMSETPVTFKEVGSNLNEQASLVSQQKVKDAASNHVGFVSFSKVPLKASHSNWLTPPSRPAVGRPGLQAGISFDLQKVGSQSASHAPPKLKFYPEFFSPSRPGSFSPAQGVSGSVSGALSLSVPTQRGSGVLAQNPFVKLGPFPGGNSWNFPSKSLYQSSVPMPARVSSLGSQGTTGQLPLLNFKVPASSTSTQKMIGSWFPSTVSSGSSHQVSSARGGSSSWSLQSQSTPSLSEPIAVSSLYSKLKSFPMFSKVLGSDRGFESSRPDFSNKWTVSEPSSKTVYAPYVPWSGPSERHSKSLSEVKTPTYSQFGWSTGDNPSDTVSFLHSLGVPSELSSAKLDSVKNPSPASLLSTKIQTGPYGGSASGQPVPASWFQSPSWTLNRILSSKGSSTAAKVPPSTQAFPGLSAFPLKQLGQKFLPVVPSRREGPTGLVPQTSWLPAGFSFPQHRPLSRFFPQTASDVGKRVSPGRLGADQPSNLKTALKFLSSNPSRLLTSLTGRDSVQLQGFSQSGARFPLKQASLKVDLPNFSNQLLSSGLKAVMSRKSGSRFSQRFASPGFY